MHSFRISRWLPFLLCWITTGAFAQNTYTNTTYGFSIDFPAGWRQKTSAVEHTLIKATHNTDEIICYMSIAAYTLTTDEGSRINAATASGGYSLIKTTFGMETMTLLKTGTATVAGISMHWCTNSFQVMGKSTRCKTYYFARGANLFRFTYCCDATTSYYDDALKLFETSIGTLRFDK